MLRPGELGAEKAGEKAPILAAVTLGKGRQRGHSFYCLLGGAALMSTERWWVAMHTHMLINLTFTHWYCDQGGSIAGGRQMEIKAQNKFYWK